MTVATKTMIKANWINATTLIAVLTFIIYNSKWQEKVDNHMEDNQIHMTFEKKIQIFVPRVELDFRLRNIEDTQNKMYNLMLNNKK